MDAQELEQLRLRAGRTQAECGAAIGVSRQSYTQREKGVTPIGEEEAAALRAFLAAPAGGAPLTLAEQLRGARAWAGRTINECAEVLGISREAYRAREAGTPEPTPRELERLAALFGRPRAQLFRSGPRRGPAPAIPPPPLAETLPEQLRYWRGVAAFSNEDAAAAIGTHRDGYRAREAGTTPVSGAELALLARAYGRPLFELFPAYEPTDAELLFHRALAKVLSAEVFRARARAS
jgi:transcriptional regulator with XRE-family HTH domain